MPPETGRHWLVWRVIAVSGLLTLTACAGAPAHAAGPAAVVPSVLSRAVVQVQGRWLALRLSRPVPAASTPEATARPLVFFITGDGGWRGKDLDAFEHLRGLGYDVAGVSAPDYLGQLADGVDHIPPQVLADDLATMIDVARRALTMPAAPVLLCGVSRGADLAVVAAARPSLASAIRGVVAVALTAEEEFVHVPRRARHHQARPAAAATHGDDTDDGGFDDPPLARPYAALRRIPVPVALIQSTNDEYVPAAQARQLFGPDTPARQMHAINARNHSFSDARSALYDAVRESLRWVAHPGSPQVTP